MLTLVGLVAQAVLSFVLAVVVTRGLQARGAGVFFQAVALFSILAAVAEFGAGAGVVRTIPRFRTLDRGGEVRAVLRAALWPVVGVASGAALVLVLVAPAAARVFDLGPQGSGFLRLLAPFLPLAAGTTVLLAATRALGTMAPYVAIENLAKPALRPALAAAAIAAGFGPFLVTMSWALPIAVLFPLALLAALRTLRRVEAGTAPTAVPARAVAGEFWRFAAPRGLAAAFQVTTVWLDVLLIGSLRSTGEAGIYAAVGRLSTVGVFAIEAVRLAIAPAISTMLAREDRAGAQELYRVGTWWLVALSWPLYLTLAIFAPVVLGLFGPEFVRGQDALLVLSLAMILSVGTGNVTVMLLMGGKSVWNLTNTILSLGVNIALNLILIPRLGMVGAAIAWTASIATNNLIPLFQVRRLLRVTPFGRGFAIIGGATVVVFGGIGLAMRSLVGATPMGLLLTLALALPLYGVVLYRARNALHLPVFRDVATGLMARFRGKARPG
jgi:O-antigen/teichoic acid export membrane protein